MVLAADAARRLAMARRDRESTATASDDKQDSTISFTIPSAFGSPAPPAAITLGLYSKVQGHSKGRGPTPSLIIRGVVRLPAASVTRVAGSPRRRPGPLARTENMRPPTGFGVAERRRWHGVRARSAMRNAPSARGEADGAACRRPVVHSIVAKCREAVERANRSTTEGATVRSRRGAARRPSRRQLLD